MPRSVKLFTLVLLGTIPACSDSTSPVSVSLNWTKWKNQGIHTYSYDAIKGCECPGFGGVVTVLVTNDVVTSAYRTDTGAGVDASAWLTIDDLFELVSTSPRENGSEVHVEFDRDMGYPRLIDTSCPAVDCGFRLTISNVRPIITTARTTLSNKHGLSTTRDQVPRFTRSLVSLLPSSSRQRSILA